MTVVSHIVFTADASQVKKATADIRAARAALKGLNGEAGAKEIAIANAKAAGKVAVEQARERAKVNVAGVKAEMQAKLSRERDIAGIVKARQRSEIANEQKMLGIKREGLKLEQVREREAGRAARAALGGSRGGLTAATGGSAGFASGAVDVLGGGQSLAYGAASAMVAWAAAASSAVAMMTAKGIELATDIAAFKETTLKSGEVFLGDARASADFFAEGMRIAKDAGVDARSTIAGMNKLLGEGFKTESIVDLTKAFTDLKALKPGTDIESIAVRLGQIKATGYLQGDELNELANAGVSRMLIYKEIAKQQGKTIAEVQKMQTARQITADMVEKALIASVPALTKMPLGEFAKSQGETITKLMDRVKSIPSNFFLSMDNFDSGPIKGAMKNVLAFFDGPGGKALQDAAGKFLTSATKAIFGPFEGEDGAKRIEKLGNGVTNALDKMTTFAENAAPVIEKIVDIIADFGDASSTSKGGEGFFAMLGPLALVMQYFNQGIATIQLFGAMWDLAAAGVRGAAGAIGEAAADLGRAIVDGLTNAIAGGAGAVAGAVVGLAKGAIAGARGPQGFDSHSPSRKMMDVGYDAIAGLKAPMLANDNGVAWAGAGLAQRAMGGTTAGLGDALSPGGRAAAGGGAVTFAPVYHLAPGTTAETEAAVRRANAEAQAEFEARLEIAHGRLASGWG